MQKLPHLVAIAAALTISHQALSQAALEEVIVTATKRAESLQDIPISVNALSETTIQEAGINDIGDVAALVPALTVAGIPSISTCTVSVLGEAGVPKSVWRTLFIG